MYQLLEQLNTSLLIFPFLVLQKKKLVADEEKDPININKKRHENVTKNMENIFHNLTDQSKKAAWNIPRLKELLISDNDESDSSEWKPDEHE